MPCSLALAVVAAVLLAVAQPAGAAWRWPLHGEVGRAFAVSPARPYAAGQHRGVDLRARPGTPVRSVCAGRVRFAGRVGRRRGVVSVRCGGWVATYLELGAVAVRRRDVIRAGSRLGAVGAAAHLHLGARDAATGRYVDPLRLLRAPDGPSLGPAPDGRPRARWVAPALRPARPAPVTAPHAAGVPAAAWVGLGLVAAGLPLGGVLARHRSRQRRSWTSTSPARRPSRSAR